MKSRHLQWIAVFAIGMLLGLAAAFRDRLFDQFATPASPLKARGLAALKAWSQRPSVPAPIKDDLLVSLYALEHVDLAALRTRLAQRLELHADRLARFQTILKRHFSSDHLSLSQTGRLLGLRMGLRYEQACIDWCQEALQSLPAASGAAVSAMPARRKPTVV